MLSYKAPKILRSSVATLASATTAAETIGNNNNDLLVEIFLRLPIESLLKFKSVSKRWLSLISNPRLSHRRTTFRPNAPSGIFLRRSCPGKPMFAFVNLSMSPSRPPFESLSFVEQRYEIVILQSCNGLLLCSNEGVDYSKRDYYIYNPTTKQYTTLPNFQSTEGEDVKAIFGVNLAFDPSKSSNYKVICVRNSDSSMNNYQVEIYSPQAGPWRPCRGMFAAPCSMSFDCGVYWNGAIHWISTWENSLYFDLSEEKIHEMPMPKVPDGWEYRNVDYFGECGGHLHLIEIYEPQTLGFDVYEMQEDHSGWFVKYHVDLHFIPIAYPEMIPTEEDLGPSKFSVLSIIRTKFDEESYMVLKIPGKALRVNIKSARFENLVDIVEERGTSPAVVPVGFGLIDAYLYISSLACV